MEHSPDDAAAAAAAAARQHRMAILQQLRKNKNKTKTTKNNTTKNKTTKKRKAIVADSPRPRPLALTFSRARARGLHHWYHDHAHALVHHDAGRESLGARSRGPSGEPRGAHGRWYRAALLCISDRFGGNNLLSLASRCGLSSVKQRTPRRTRHCLQRVRDVCKQAKAWTQCLRLFLARLPISSASSCNVRCTDVHISSRNRSSTKPH